MQDETFNQDLLQLLFNLVTWLYLKWVVFKYQKIQNNSLLLRFGLCRMVPVFFLPCFTFLFVQRLFSCWFIFCLEIQPEIIPQSETRDENCMLLFPLHCHEIAAPYLFHRNHFTMQLCSVEVINTLGGLLRCWHCHKAIAASPRTASICHHFCTNHLWEKKKKSKYFVSASPSLNKF